MSARSERGIALAAAIYALLAMGLLVAAGFHAGHLEQRTARVVFYAVQAAGAAEAGVAVVLGNWNGTPRLGSLAEGESVVLPAVPLAGRAGYAVTVTRLAGELYLVRSEGRRTDGAGAVLARRIVAVTVRVSGSAVAPLRQRSWAPVY